MGGLNLVSLVTMVTILYLIVSLYQRSQIIFAMIKMICDVKLIASFLYRSLKFLMGFSTGALVSLTNRFFGINLLTLYTGLEPNVKISQST